MDRETIEHLERHTVFRPKAGQPLTHTQLEELARMVGIYDSSQNASKLMQQIGMFAYTHQREEVFTDLRVALPELLRVYRLHKQAEATSYRSGGEFGDPPRRREEPA